MRIFENNRSCIPKFLTAGEDKSKTIKKESFHNVLKNITTILIEHCEHHSNILIELPFLLTQKITIFDKSCPI